MTKRNDHNIESNCVTFEDHCYNEQDSYYDSILKMDTKEQQYIHRTGQKFVEYLKNLLGV